MAFEILQEEVYRENILVRGKRADGRQPADLREISCETGVLPEFMVLLFSLVVKHNLWSCPHWGQVEMFRN